MKGSERNKDSLIYLKKGRHFSETVSMRIGTFVTGPRKTINPYGANDFIA